MNNQFLSLFEHCRPVKGHNKFIICDLQRNAIYNINETVFQILNDIKIRTIDELYTRYNKEDLDYYIDYLIEEDIIFRTNAPQSFPELSLEFDFPGLISNAIIERKKSSEYDIANLLFKLENVGCRYIELRLYDSSNKNYIIDHINKFEHTKFRNILLVVKYFEDLNDKFLDELMRSYQRVGGIIIHSYNRDPDSLPAHLQQKVAITNKSIDNNKHCGVALKYFFSVNLKMFSESIEYNSCLNKKISIDPEGNIMNCPSLPFKYGNIHDVEIDELIDKTEFSKYWNINKDQIIKCKDCVYRYVCTDCRAFLEEPGNIYSKPLKCGYDPYKDEWTEWSDKNKKAINYYSERELL